MLPTSSGSFKLFRVRGIQVYLHWSWFLIAAFELSGRKEAYLSPIWNVLEYLGLFGIVLLHEFGHALACRSVGGQANQIVLWPFGGVAYVNPPQRPGATLWSIAAGPLVNVVLFVVLTGGGMAMRAVGWPEALADLRSCYRAIWFINLGLLIFNMLPVYPLDGGQILRSLLWFGLGRAKSLLVATIIGFVGVAGFIALAIWQRSIWLGLVAAFIGTNCWRGWQYARALIQFEKAPRHHGFACPTCRQSPPQLALWQCGKCGTSFDTFGSNATCPKCAQQYTETRCLECGTISPFAAWQVETLTVTE